LEWDLTFQGESTRRSFEHVDEEPLTILSRIKARFSTWCRIRAWYAETRWHAEHHHRYLREARTSGEIRA
jgi:hypothetical protein